MTLWYGETSHSCACCYIIFLFNTRMPIGLMCRNVLAWRICSVWWYLMLLCWCLCHFFRIFCLMILGERFSFQGRTGQKGTQGSPSSRGSRVSISMDIYRPSLSPEDATEAFRVCAPAVNWASSPILTLLSFGVKIAQLAKNPTAMQETPVLSLGWEDPLERGKATHSSILGLPLWLSC